MRRTIALILISICMAGAAAGCGGAGSGTHGGGTQGSGSQGAGASGGGSQGTGSQGGGTEHTMSVMRQLAHCIRSHGMPGWPDPVLNPLTELPDWPQNAPRVPASIQQACQSVANHLPPDVQQSQPPTPANMQALVRFARCMRAHGVTNWPDPNALGEFPLTTQMSGQFKSGDQRANSACIHEVPGGSQYLRFVGAAPQQGSAGNG
jgi:hypothetical protein